MLDGRLLIGIGAGLIIASVCMTSFPKRELSAIEIETRARAMGMIYEDEIKAIPKSTEGGENN